MNKIIRLAAFAFLCACFFSQNAVASGPESIESVAETVRYQDGSNKVRFAKLRPGVVVPQANFPAWAASTLGLPATSTLVLEGLEADNLGFEHATFRQHINGIPMEPGVLKAHFRNGQLVAFNGDYHQTEPTNKAFGLAEADALQLAMNHMGATQYRHVVEQIAAPKGQRIYLKTADATLIPVWAFRLYSYEPHDRQDVYVNANDGSLVGMVKRLYNANATGTATTKYSGTQTIETDSLAVDSFRLRDYTRGNGIITHNQQNTLFQFNAIDFWDTDNNWNNVNANQDEVATDAHWAAEQFYDYFYGTYGRDSYDGAGAQLNTYVHYFVNYTNAFWDGSSVTVGDGDGTNYGPLATVDIISHEYTHGLVESTSNFTFSYEPGALTESYCDIFGSVVEWYAKPTSANWTMQEDASLATTPVPVRSLADPKVYSQPDTYEGQFWEFGAADNGGVHTNGGVQNHWFYLLVNGGAGTNDNTDFYNVQGIGITDAAAIAYRALNTYHTSTSQYSDALAYTKQAAEDLFGVCSQQVISCEEAWYAVGVGPSTNPATADFTVDQTFSCGVPTTVQFSDSSTNAVTWFWDFGDNHTDTAQNPSHQYDTAGVYTVMLVVTGVGCSGAPDTLVQSNLITITNGGGPIAAVCTPMTQNPGFGNIGVLNVTIGGINNTTNGGADNYQDYTCANSTTLNAGDLAALSVTVAGGGGPFGGEDLRVWIDYDNDGDFNNANELIMSLDNISGTQSTTFTVPTNAVQFTPLRMRVMSDWVNNTLATACTAPQFGQAEDYTIVIDTVSGPPTAMFSSNAGTGVYIGSTVSFTDLSSGSPTSWSWTFTGASTTSSTAQNPAVVYPTAGVYPVSLTVCSGFGCDSTTINSFITVVDVPNMCSYSFASSQTGTFYDSGGPNNVYGNNENCAFLIAPPCALSVTLDFSVIDFPSSADRVRIYDGTSDTDPLLATIGGPNFPIPPPIVANSGTMYITFISDGSGMYNGWTANWSSVVTSTPVVAAISPNTNNPAWGSAVAFTDASTGTAAEWFWDFGDGSTSTLQNPSHLYTAIDTFQVMLIATNCQSTDTAYTTIITAPPGQINVDPDSINGFSNMCLDTVVVPVTVWNTGGGPLSVIVDDGPTVGCVMLVATVNMVQFANEHSWELRDGLGTTLLSELGANVGNNTTWIDSVCVNPGQYTFETIDTFGDGWNGGTYDLSACGVTVANNGGAPPTNNGTTENFNVNYCVAPVPWMEAAPDSFDILPGDTTVFNVLLMTDGLTTGTYSSSLLINSGDTLNPAITIPVTFEVVLDPEIVLTDTCLHFDTIAVGSTGTQNMVISNTGCVDLDVTGMVFTDPSYSSIFTSFTVAAGGFASIPVSFNPTSAGSAPAMLTLQTNAGDTTLCLTGTGLVAPVAAFTSALTDTCAGFVQFTDGSSNSPSSWFWTFGDNTTSSQQNPLHIYGEPGMYTVTLIATNVLGSDTITDSVTVLSADPSFTLAGTPVVGDSILVTANDPAGTAWSWSFGDGGTASTNPAYYPYAAAGNYTVALVMTNAYGCTDSSNQQVVVTMPLPPTAAIAYTITDTCAGMVSFADSSANFATSWAWDFGDGNTDNVQHPMHQYDSAGTYTVTLIATNIAGSDTATTTITIDVINASIDISGPLQIGAIHTFTDLGTGADSWAWDFGDTTSATGNPAVHSYQNLLTYPVTLVATNAAGCVDTDSVSITISPAPPTSDFDWVLLDSCGSAVQFTDLSLYDPDSWTWDFGDGSPTSPMQSPLYTYAAAGTYNVSLVVSNQTGSDTLVQVVTVVMLDAGFTVSGNMIVGETITFTSTDAGASQWFWDFDDSSGGLGETELHVFQDTGTYNVTLITENSFSCLDTITQAVQIISVLPEASFASANDDPCIGSVAFTNTSANSSSWSWDFGDGNTSSDQHPVHVYGASGTYTVTLISSNAVGSDTATAQVTVTIPTITAGFTWSGDTLVTLPISFVNTSDAGTYLWDFGNGDTSVATNPVVSFPDSGTFIVCLIATDGCVSDTVCDTLMIVDPDNSIGHIGALNGITVYPNPTRGLVTVNLNGLATDATVRVFNTLGALKTTQRINAGGVANLQLEALASGMYLVQVSSGSATQTWRIVLED